MEHIYFPFFKNIYSRNFSSSSEATTASSSTDISPSHIHINIIIIVSTAVLAFTLLIFIFMLAKRLQTTCCRGEPELGVYGIVSAEESTCDGSRDFVHQINHPSELNPVLDISTSISENASLWYDSEYDNLSLNPEVHDSDILDSPPEYEHPPSYESTTRRSSKSLGNFENV